MANTSNRKRIPVSLYLAESAETGETCVLEDAKFFAEAKTLQLKSLETLLAEARIKNSAITAEMAQQARDEQVALITARIDEMAAVHENARKTARREDFTLRKPSYGSYMTARSAAFVESSQGERVFDRSIYERELLSDDGIEGLSPSDVLNLDPAVALKLGSLLAGMVTMSEARLPLFVSPPALP